MIGIQVVQEKFEIVPIGVHVDRHPSVVDTMFDAFIGSVFACIQNDTHSKLSRNVQISFCRDSVMVSTSSDQ